MTAVTERLQERLWQSYAHLYDGLLDVHTYRDMLARVADVADVAGRRVFDAGAGTGNVTRALLDAGAAHVVAVDLSSNMLGHARRKLAADVAAGRVRIAEADAVAALAELPAGSVDRITAVNFLYTLPRDVRAGFFRQAARALAPGGFVVAAHTTRPGAGPIIRDQYRRAGIRGTVRARLLGIAAVDLVIDSLARGGRYDFSPVDALAAEAREAGLSVTESLGRCYGGETDGVNELLRFARSAQD